MARAIALAVVLAALSQSQVVHAGGLYLTDRGTRPMGRGGAFVAGADDPSSLWYNPAGLAYSGRQLMFDATYNFFSADYTRIDSGGNTLQPVSVETAPLPIPGLMYTDHFGLRDFTFGVGAFAPNALLLTWPESVMENGAAIPAPQRYSLLSMHGSLLANLAIGAAWHPSEHLSIGITGQLIVGTFQTTTTVSTCDGALCTQPENPEYDSVAELHMGGIAQPTASFGAIYDLGVMRLGASLVLPYSLSGGAKISVRLPSAAPFDNARIEGDSAQVNLPFPLILRLGVEARPMENLRAELAFVYEGWSAQDKLSVTPENIWLRDIEVVGDYQLGPLNVPRQMTDVWSIRVGGEYEVGHLVLRAGFSYENGAFPSAYLTPLTLDTDKATASIGASYEVTEGVFIDALLMHVFMRNRMVRDSQVPPQNPIRPEANDPIVVGNGDYVMEDTTIGVGLRWVFAPPVRQAPASAR